MPRKTTKPESYRNESAYDQLRDIEDEINYRNKTGRDLEGQPTTDDAYLREIEDERSGWNQLPEDDVLKTYREPYRGRK